jgi:hypothetical protein
MRTIWAWWSAGGIDPETDPLRAVAVSFKTAAGGPGEMNA